MAQSRRPSSNKPQRPPPLSGYQAQYERVVRCLARVTRTPYRDAADLQDDYLTFFMHSWHLNEHINNDISLPEPGRNQIVDAVQGDPDLTLCQDIANGCKHCVFKPGSPTTMSITERVMGGPMAHYPLVEDEQGHHHRAHDLANRLAAKWETLLKTAGLAVPSVSAIVSRYEKRQADR